MTELGTLAYVARCRAANRWHDLRALLGGYCNHRPWQPEPDQGGGYAHWRCALRRGHDGLHRALNYVWSDDGKTSYLPIPPGMPMPRQPWERHMMPTRRDARRSRRWQQRQSEARRARR